MQITIFIQFKRIATLLFNVGDLIAQRYEFTITMDDFEINTFEMQIHSIFLGHALHGFSFKLGA